MVISLSSILSIFAIAQPLAERCNHLFFKTCVEISAEGELNGTTQALPTQPSMPNLDTLPVSGVLIDSQLNLSSYKLQSWLNTGKNEYVFIVDQANKWYILQKTNKPATTNEIIFLGKATNFYEFMFQETIILLNIGHSLSMSFNE